MKQILFICMMAAVVSANAQNKRSMVINKLRSTQKEVMVHSDASDTKEKNDNNTVGEIQEEQRVPVELVSVEDGVQTDELVFTDDEVLEGSYPLLDGVLTTSPWKGNWFFNIQGGASASVGTPKGCGDLFDRTSFSINGSLGKWFTPGIGTRIAYQGYKFKDYNMVSQNYHTIHMDLMYNIASHFHNYADCMSEYSPQPKWDVIPYIGAGIMWSSLRPGGLCDDCEIPNINHPFAIAYGVQMRYRVAKRLHITAELGGMTTCQSFDGCGSASRFGDNMLSVSAGISLTLGKVGWHRAVDAASIIRENEILKSRIYDYEKNEFDRENGDSNDNNDKNDSCKNDSSTETLSLSSSNDSYSGLESLRNRLRNHGKAFNGKEAIDGTAKPAIGVPVFFFFHLNSDVLVDESQLVNLDEIAKVAKEKTLIVRITGAADSATGSEEQNRELAKMRTKYIAKALLDRGVPLEQLHGFSYGGTDMYKRNEENRFTRCVLVEKE